MSLYLYDLVSSRLLLIQYKTNAEFWEISKSGLFTEKMISYYVKRVDVWKLCIWHITKTPPHVLPLPIEFTNIWYQSIDLLQSYQAQTVKIHIDMFSTWSCLF